MSQPTAAFLSVLKATSLERCGSKEESFKIKGSGAESYTPNNIFWEECLFPLLSGHEM